MTVGDEIDGSDLMAEPVRAGYNLSCTVRSDGGEQFHHHERRRWDTDAVAALAAPRGWLELLSELPGVLRLGFFLA
jgi:hypothetical protein